jgi:hypothetical protein
MPLMFPPGSGVGHVVSPRRYGGQLLGAATAALRGWRAGDRASSEDGALMSDPGVTLGLSK